MMGLLRLTLIGIAILIAAGCEQNRTTLQLVRPDGAVDSEIIDDVVSLLGRNGTVMVTLTGAKMSDEAALDALQAGDADLALVSNNMPYRDGIATVMPLYPAVLHVGSLGDPAAQPPGEMVSRDSDSPAESSSRESDSRDELSSPKPATARERIMGKRIYAGSKGSASRMMFENFARRKKLTPDDYTYVEFPATIGEADENPDIFVVFAPLSPDRLSSLRADFPEMELISSGSPSDIGTGAEIDATVLLNPRLQPFVIPVGTYGKATPTAILTVAVDMLLVSRSDLSPSAVYDLVRELNRLRPALASQRPGVFQHQQDDFNSDNSTFVLHPGLVAYLDRNEPSIYERYSGVAEVAVTLIVALFSATFAGVRIFQVRRKNRIDVFYKQVIAIRSKISESSTDDERAEATQKVRDLQNTAFAMLIDEKLAADESFHIFMSLSNDTLRNLGSSTVPAPA